MLNKLKRWIAIWKKQKDVANLNNERSEKTEGICLIKLDAIGDFIIWLDSAKEYRKIYPNNEITLICNKACVSIAESTGYFDKVIDLDINCAEFNASYFMEQTEKLSICQYGLLIQTAYSRTLHMDLLAAAIHANQKIAFRSDETSANLSRRLVSAENRVILDKIYDRLIESPPETLMELKRNALMISALNGMDYKSKMPVLKENIDYADKVPDYDYFVVFPGASTKRKMWSISRFATVTDYILEKKNWKALICGSKDEVILGTEIRKASTFDERIVNYCGQTNLLELAEIVRKAKIVISNDTSGIHFTAATGTPGICIFGEFDYGRFLPYIPDIGSSNIYICSANSKCRGCKTKGMTMKCRIRTLMRGCYDCIDRVNIDQVKRQVNLIFDNEGEIV